MPGETTLAPLLLIGPDGMLGRAFTELLTARRLPFAAVSYPRFDLARASDVDGALARHFRVVVNCAAYTDVDRAETDEATANAVNAEGPRRLAERCRQIGAVLVHYSTDYVFDGLARAPYATTHARAPQNAYGRSKARGEEAVVHSGCEHLIVRTSWLYAPWGKSFVDTIARSAASRPELRVVDDQRGRPTSAQYLAARTLALLSLGARGIFHVTDGGECTWFELARQIVERLALPAEVTACTSAEFPRPAKRPAYSVLDLVATEALLGPSRPWQENLAQVLRARAEGEK